MVLNGTECLLINTDICILFQTYGEKQQHSTWDGKGKIHNKIIKFCCIHGLYL